MAQELHADHLLVDECSARATAAALGLHVIGTLGVLKQAAERRLIDLQASLNRLLATTYRIDPALVQRLIEDHRESRQ